MTDTSAARSAIEAAICDYIEGWYEGDASRMDRALHAELVKRIPASAGEAGARDLRVVSKERMVRLTAEGGGDMPGADYEIVVHDVSGPVASAQVRSVEYLDYLQLVATDDGWKIANILFRTHE